MAFPKLPSKLREPGALALEFSIIGLFIRFLVPLGSLVSILFAGISFYYSVLALDLTKIMVGSSTLSENKFAGEICAISFAFFGLGTEIFLLFVGDVYWGYDFSSFAFGRVGLLFFVGLCFLVAILYKYGHTDWDTVESQRHRVFLSRLDMDARRIFDRAIDLCIYFSYIMGLGFSDFLDVAALGIAIISLLRSLGRISVTSDVIGILRRASGAAKGFEDSFWLNVLDAANYPSGYVHLGLGGIVGLIAAWNLPFVRPELSGSLTVLILTGLLGWCFWAIRHRIRSAWVTLVPAILGSVVLVVNSLLNMDAIPVAYAMGRVLQGMGSPPDIVEKVQFFLGFSISFSMICIIPLLIPLIQYHVAEFRVDYSQGKKWLGVWCFGISVVVPLFFLSTLSFASWLGLLAWDDALFRAVIFSLPVEGFLPFVYRHYLGKFQKRVGSSNNA